MIAASICLRRPAIVRSGRLRHLAVEELQERLVMDPFLDQERGNSAMQAHPHRRRQLLGLHESAQL